MFFVYVACRAENENKLLAEIAADIFVIEIKFLQIVA